MAGKQDKERPQRPPARTPEQRENQLTALAHDLAEQQLREGTASAQVISHFLKQGSERERLEKERLVSENQLLLARVEQLQSATRMEELTRDAINAFRSYSGQDPDGGEYYDD